MNMKVDSYIATAGIRQGAARSPVKASEAAVSGAASAEGPMAAVSPVDTVQLTGNAVQLQRSEQVLQSGAGNSQRVAQLKQAVAAGSYQVNASAVADKMQRMDWQLGAR